MRIPPPSLVWTLSPAIRRVQKGPGADARLRRGSSRFSLPELKAKLGDASGTWLWEIVRGLDYTEGALPQGCFPPSFDGTGRADALPAAVDTKTQVKSMISSKNFRPSIGTYGEVVRLASGVD